MCKTVSVAWINYNSMKFMNVALESLRSLYELNYPNMRIILIDNCSNDGSDRILKDYVEKVDKRNITKFYRTSKNYGYAGGNLLAYMLTRGSGEYFAVVNNDVIVEGESLGKLVEALEDDERVGAVQGLLRSPNKAVNSAGHLLDEFLVSYAICLGKVDHPLLHQPYYVTYTCGAYSVYRMEALKMLDRVYFPEAFGYLDDDLIGLRMWSLGYRSKYAPVESGTHYGGQSFRQYSTLSDECNVRNRLIFRLITENRFKALALPASIMRLIPSTVSVKALKSTSRAIVHGLNYARERIRRGFRIGVEGAPLIKLTALEVLAHTILPNRISKKLVIKRLRDRIPLG